MRNIVNESSYQKVSNYCFKLSNKESPLYDLRFYGKDLILISGKEDLYIFDTDSERVKSKLSDSILTNIPVYSAKRFSNDEVILQSDEIIIILNLVTNQVVNKLRIKNSVFDEFTNTLFKEN